MKFENEILSKDISYQKLSAEIKAGALPIMASGLSEIHKALVLSALFDGTGKKIAVITKDEAAATALLEDLICFGKNAVILPQRDYNLARMQGYSREYEQKRIDTLSKVFDGDFDILVLSLDSALQYTLPPNVLEKSRFKIEVGKSYDITGLCDKLIASGYERYEICDGAGQFCVRGGIMDIFPIGCKNPVRIEFWGDEADSISQFDIFTQRRGETLSSVTVCPATELPYEKEMLAEKIENILTKRRKEQPADKFAYGDIELLRSGIRVEPDLYIPLLYEKRATVFDYLDGVLFALCESGNIKERFKSLGIAHNEDIKNLITNGIILSECADCYLSKADFLSYTEKALFLETFPRSSFEVPFKSVINFDYKRISAWSGDVTSLKEDLEISLKNGGSAVILAGESKSAALLCEELCEKGIKASFSETFKCVKNGVLVTLGGLSSGFEIPSQKFSLFTHRYILSEEKHRKKRPKNSKEIGSLDELKCGDYVVHVSHGIGIFDGINSIKTGGVTKDYICIKYFGSDVLYVPVTQLDLVSKYIGAAENGGIKLNRLGSSEWNKTKSRVRSAVKNMAKELTALYAKRMSAKGYAFSVDTDLQNNFERRFEYEETEDQLRSVNEIKRDMERDIPMDRLLCGDVGFGKTEVALRAAFKCISEGKQCALLVPTTILALQHYNTVIRRFGDMPVTVKMLSRFVPLKEQKKTVSDIKLGKVDMVIGTHRLISKDVSFKDIGLVIIDEEQRFGVAQKERLKELYPFVDILTLSATPIPRTLNMAMSGLRDMSSIDEAPLDRYPVQTYVLEQNDGVICDAINKELRRGGQVYYLHNRVESIESRAAKLKEKIPNARFAVAHGKMSEEELTDVWKRLLEHEIDVLVCTTIIETGVDVPNANTLIIENADRMGLSQLHQLRGRVGRSPRRAFAYFCFSRGKELSEIAAKRLEAIREFTEFGSGFKIALRDLEIRGAGSILGSEQHGNMEAVGYDMYLKLLSDAVNEENGVTVQSSIKEECSVDLSVSAHIPEKYIESLPARLGIYKRIADINTDEDVSDIIDELCDRFGEPPQSVMGLIDISLLRAKAAKYGIKEITGSDFSVILHSDAINEELQKLLFDAFGDKFSMSLKSKTLYIIRLLPKQKHSEIVSFLARVL